MVKQKDTSTIVPPTLWRTCRIIANESRLKLLREIFELPRKDVSTLAASVGLTLGSTSNQLTLLCNEGFITPHRRGQQVLYDGVIPYAPLHIKKLQAALKKELLSESPLHTIYREATGLSHQRRVELIRRLSKSPRSMEQLLTETVMSYSALSRHLKKLIARGYVSSSAKQYRLETPSGTLAKTLIQIITTTQPV
jgi:DNA-binding transcriptional ArsR family regulator